MNQKQSPRDENSNEPDRNPSQDTGEDGGVSPHSVSRIHGTLQPDGPQLDGPQPSDGTPHASHDNAVTTLPGSATPSAHVVLYQPEIPQNTGNIGRTCVATGAKLWIVRPAAFRIDHAKLRRAGLDYWQHLDIGDAVNWDDLVRQLAPRRMFFLSRFAKRNIWDASFRRDDVFVFGSESSGLPASILSADDPCALRLPTTTPVRSLNLATTVGIVLYEQQRQLALAAQQSPLLARQSETGEREQGGRSADSGGLS